MRIRREIRTIMIDKIVALLILLVVGSAVLARVSETGPFIWIKRAARRGRALEGSDRRELVARVQQLLPQANDGNVVFSLHRESSASGGSQFTVLSSTYYPMVFVVDGDAFWMIPMAYDRHKRSYALGAPERFSAADVRQMRLTGKRGKTLIFTFLMELDGRKREIDMDLTPFCFRKNRFYPFDLMQDAACDRAMKLAEAMALAACHLTPEDLEAGRLKDECSSYGTYAACTGVFGVMFAAAESLPIVLVCFGISLILFFVMLAKKQIPKVSAVVVLIEAAIAYAIMR